MEMWKFAHDMLLAGVAVGLLLAYDAFVLGFVVLHALGVL